MAPNFTFKQWVLSHLIALGILLLALYAFFGVERGVSAAVLDVGQGDAILIQTPEYKNILIDSGPDSKVVDELGARLRFFEKNIDLFVLTHPHADHYGGILDVMQKYGVKKIMLTGVAAHDPLYENFLSEARARGIPVIFPASDRDIQIGQGVYLDLVYPLSGQSFLGQKVNNANNTSIVARLRRWDGERWENLMMLTGDAEREEELEVLLSGQALASDVLKLGHHGSRTATSDPFLKAVSPHVAVISAGLDNSFGHPHAEILRKINGLKAHSTMDEGTVRFLF